MFKKKKINNDKKIVNFFTLFSIFIIFFLSLFVIDFLKNNDLKIEKKQIEGKKDKNIIENEKKIILKSDNDKNISLDNNDDKINILLLWRWGTLNDAPNLTDTIILASINKKTKTITMLSIPRDLYVEYLNWKSWKINQIYARQKVKLKDSKKAVKILENKITQITGEKIDYYVNVDFKWFSAFIDAIWWVKITVPEKLVDYRYPDWNWGYRTLVIRKWTWLFDWDVALMYARSRHSTSDFDRSLRQQQIITAVKDKLNEGWFFSKAMKVKKFYDVFKKYVDTDLDMLDMLKIFNQVWSGNDYKILSFNINDSCFFGDPNCSAGWFLYVPQRELYWWASVLLPNTAYLWNISDYSQIKKYTNLIFNYPEIYKEKFKINIFNSTRTRWIAWDLANILTRYWLNIPKLHSIWNIRNKQYLKTTIYYNQEIRDSTTLKFLKESMWEQVELIEVEQPVKAEEDNVKIEIVLWEDYSNIFKNLKNNL